MKKMKFVNQLIILVAFVTLQCVFCQDYTEGATKLSEELEGDDDNAFIVVDENSNEGAFARDNVNDPETKDSNENDEEEDEEEQVTIFNDNSDSAEKKPENDDESSKASPDFSELPFNEKLKKIKMIPLTRYIYEGSESRKPDMLQPIKQEISINFVIKPKITIRPVDEEEDGVSSGSGSSGDGLGSGGSGSGEINEDNQNNHSEEEKKNTAEDVQSNKSDENMSISEDNQNKESEEKKNVSENVQIKNITAGNNANEKKNTTTSTDISAYIVKDTDSSGSGEDGSGSGKDEENESGSGSQFQQNDKSILTFKLEALTKPNNHMLNETTHTIQSISQRERARRSVSKHHENQKKGFVPEEEGNNIYIPQRNEDVQNQEQLTKLFMSTLHTDFQTQPEFGNADDQWSNTDVKDLSSMTQDGAEIQKEIQADQQLQTREFETKMKEIEPPQTIHIRQPPMNQINSYSEHIEETPQADEGRSNQVSQIPFDDSTQMGMAVEQPSDNFEALPHQRSPQKTHASFMKMAPHRMVEPALLKKPETEASAKLSAMKQSKSEFEAAEAKYEAMENAQLATELQNRKESFKLNAGYDVNASARSHLSKQIKQRTKTHKKQRR